MQGLPWQILFIFLFFSQLCLLKQLIWIIFSDKIFGLKVSIGWYLQKKKIQYFFRIFLNFFRFFFIFLLGKKLPAVGLLEKTNRRAQELPCGIELLGVAFWIFLFAKKWLPLDNFKKQIGWPSMRHVESCRWAATVARVKFFLNRARALHAPALKKFKQQR